MKNTNYNLELIFFIVSALLLCIFILIISYYLGGRSYGRNKNTAFESGIMPTGNTRIKFSAKFYLVAIFFVVFDIESIYLYIWSICIREVGWTGFIEATIFIFTLLIGLIYIIRLGVLDWSIKNKNIKEKIL